MIVDRRIAIAAPAAETYRRVLDIAFLGSCLPGAQDIAEQGPDAYSGTFALKIGPVAVTLRGTVEVVTRHEQGRKVELRLSGKDRGVGGSVTGDMLIEVVDTAPGRCELVVRTEVTVAGKIGQFGQAVMLKKADQITARFAENFSRRLTGNESLAALETPTAAALPTTEIAGSATVSTSVPAPTGHDTKIALVRTLLRHAAARLELTDSPNPPAPTAERLQLVRAATPDAVAAALSQIRGRRIRPAALAVLPRGAAVGDPAAIGDLCRAAATLGVPVLAVSDTPWDALPLARVVAAGAAHGLIVRLEPHPATEPAAAVLLASALAQIRAASLTIPVLAGPAARHGRLVITAGADAVLPAPRGAAEALRARLHPLLDRNALP